MNTWDEDKKRNMSVIGNRIKWVPENDGHHAHFDIDGVYNLYMEELFIMIEFLQAEGMLRFAANHTESQERF